MQSLHIEFHSICNLKTRNVEATIKMPAILRPAPHMDIVDLHQFVTTALTRLDSDSPLLRGIAERSLLAVKNALKQ